MGSAFIFLFFFVFFIVFMIKNAANNTKKKQDQAKGNAQKPQPGQKAAQGTAPAAARGTHSGNGQQPPRVKKPAAVHEGEDPCHDHLYTEEYRPFQGFNAQSGFGEGTDPCHDGLRPISSFEDEKPAEDLLPGDRESREWLRGVVLSEILARPVSQRKR